MKLIVGLGNPGKEYENTRHNIGFNVIDELAKELKVTSFREKFRGLVGEGYIKEEKVFLLKPQTYMNLSGSSIKELMTFYKLEAEEDLIVIYDDMDLELGQVKIKLKGSAGGHNGIKSIISCCGENFFRIKCGIGKSKRREDVVDFVLSRFTKEEMDEVIPLVDHTVKAAQAIVLSKNIDRVIQKYNKKK